MTGAEDLRGATEVQRCPPRRGAQSVLITCAHTQMTTDTTTGVTTGGAMTDTATRGATAVRTQATCCAFRVRSLTPIADDKREPKKEKKIEVYETFEEMGLKADLLRGMYGAGMLGGVLHVCHAC